MNAFICDERERLNREMTSQLLTKLQREQSEKEIEIKILQREKKVIEEEFSYLQEVNSNQTEKLSELTESLAELSQREDKLLENNIKLSEENRKLYERLSSSRIDLEQHQLLCEKLVTEAINSEDRLQGTIESLRNKLSLSTSLSFSEVAAPLPAIQTPDRCYKVIMLGDSSTGKTSIVHRYTRDEFVSHEPTIDISYKMKAQLTARGLISIQIWDTAGQERFRSIPKCYFRKADGVLMTYDVTNQQSLLNIRSWLSDLDDMTQVVVVGNKSDLVKERRVTKENGQLMARELCAHHIEVSARTGFNIPQAFELLSRIMQENEDAQLASLTRSNTKIALSFDPAYEPKSRCC